ncbi:MAG TPA: TonB-dependent receptor [Pyrinomonadaceae bacterium]
MRRISFRFIGSGLALFVISVLAGVASGQVTTGTINGSVQDQQEAVVAGATVTIRNKETGAERTATTSESGAFIFPQVQPGSYMLTVEARGFKRTLVPDVIVQIGQAAGLNLTLETGEVAEQVTVTSGVQEVINASSPSLTNVINTRQVVDLPLGGRNPVELAGLQAGIAVVGTDVRGASVAGLRQTAVNLTQDGINSMDNFVKTSSFFAITTPSLNSTAEFSITTGTVSSESGRGGAQVNLVTKGGTNDFHGGAFYQFLNESLNANTFFNNFNGLPRPVLRQKFYGFDVGGPVYLPRFGEGGPSLIGGKDKAFFFFSFEAFRQSQSRANNRTVLSEAARNGIFTYTDNAGGTRTLNLLTLSSRGFGLNPITRAHLALVPLPNNSNCGNSDGFNILCYTFNATESNSNNKYVFRYDHQLVKETRLGSHKVEFVYSRVNTSTFPDVFTNGIDAPFPGGVHGFQASTRNLVTPALVSTFGNNVTNVVRYGRQWAPVDFNRASSPTAPFFSLSGVLTNYDNTFMPQPRNTIVNQVTDTLSWVNGNHLLKFGGDWQQVLGVSRNDAGINQTIQFGTNTANSVGFALANFPGLTANARGNAIVTAATTTYTQITGMLGSSTQTLNVTSPDSGFVPGATRLRTVQGRDLALFAQDQWRMRNNFTLNYGVRWDFMGVPTVPNGLAIQPNYSDLFGISGFGNLFSPTAAPGSQTQGFARLEFVSGDSGRGLYKNDWNNFAPFVGFAYSPEFNSGPLHFLFGDSGKSSIRAGYSMSYLHDGITTFTNLLGVGNTNPGLIASANQTSLVSPPTSNLPGVITGAGVPLVFPTFKIPITDRENFIANFNNGLWTADPDLRTAYVHQWNFGYEREIFKNTAFEIRYQGNHVPNGWRAWDINEVNIFENGFLQEFLRAQNNLNICVANATACRAAQAALGVPANLQTSSNFANLGLPGQVNLPTLSRFFNTFPVSSTSGFASTTFVSNLNNNNIGTMANTLAFNSAYRTNRENPALGLASNFFVANPNAAFARVLLNGAKSSYHAMEIELRRRFSNGLQFQADYTWSKAMVDGDAQGNNQSDLAQPLTHRNLQLDHRRSSQDQTQRFVANAIYELPFGRGRTFLSNAGGLADRIVGGWTTGVIATWSTGTPWYVASGRTTFNSSSANIGAQLTGITFEEFKKNIGVFKHPGGVLFVNPALLDITVSPTTGKITASRLKPGLMSAPAPGTFGDFPVNGLSGPKYFNLDLSVTKRIALTDDGRVRFEIKATAINILNHPNFVFGTTNFDSSTFGLITTQRGNVRTMNFIGQLRF